MRQHEQGLQEHVLQRPALARRRGPEPRDRHVIGHQVPGRDPERRIGPAPLLDPPRGPLALQVGIHQQHRQHPRVIPRAALPRLPERLQARGVQALGHVDNEPDKMVLTHPVTHVLGQQHRLIPVHRLELVSHKPILPA